jgi:predicted  nucleic acid-binding Zn-ribbon protein
MESIPAVAVPDAEAKAHQERTDAKIAELQQEIQNLKNGSGTIMPEIRQTDKEKEKQAPATPTPGSR